MLALVVTAWGCGTGARRPQNVVLISLDTTRADHLGCYGFGKDTTPHVDALAERGVRFADVVSPAPITLAAHASMLTGMIPPATGVHDNVRYRLPEDATTLAEILSAREMSTGAFVSVFVLDHEFGLAQGFDTYDDIFEKPEKTDFGTVRRGTETAEHAVRWLRAQTGRPFFLFLHLYDPHAPYDPPEPFASRCAGDPYSGEIAAADAAAGKVLATLDELGLVSETLVVLTADHGEMLGEHGESTHSYFIYRSALEVPLVMAGPGVASGVTVTPRVGLIDIVPTVCGLLGIDVPPAVQGRDLSSWLRDGVPEAPGTAYYCESVTATRYGANPLLGVVEGRWQLIRSTRPELYALDEDAEERHNLFDSRDEVARGLQRKLDDALAARPAGAGGSRASAGARARLRSLGYLGGAELDELTVEPGRPDAKDLIGLHEDNQRAIAAISAGRLDEAETLCRKMLASHPEFAEADMSLARIAIRRGRWEEAVLHLEKVLAVSPDQYEALVRLGVALTGLGRTTEAVQAFRRALPLDPEPPKARVNLARALRHAGRLEEAARQLSEALKARPDDVELADEEAELLAQAGRLAAARRRLERLALQHPDHARTLFDLAQTRIRMGDTEGAVTALRAMLATAPDDGRMELRAKTLLSAVGRPDLLSRVTGKERGRGE